MTSKEQKLSDFSEEELVEELNRRRTVKLGRPQIVAEPNFTKLIATMEEEINNVLLGGQYFDEDFEHYVYEAAIEAVYGQSFWDWKKGIN